MQYNSCTHSPHTCIILSTHCWEVSNRRTWHNVQGKWSIWTSVPTCAHNCGSIAWGSCTKAQRGNQATLVSIIAHNFCYKLSPGGGTCVVHGYFFKCFISPEKRISLSSACEGDFLWETSISSRYTASQYDLFYQWTNNTSIHLQYVEYQCSTFRMPFVTKIPSLQDSV